MGSKMSKTHLVIISLTSLAFVLVLLLLAKITGKRVLNAIIYKKRRVSRENNLSILSQSTKKTCFVVLPNFEYGKLTVKYIQPLAFSKGEQVIEEDDFGSSSFHVYAGILYINVRYDLSRSTLKVLLLKATNLPVNETNEDNFYIITTLFPQQQKSFQSRVHKTSSPEFNEFFEFALASEYLLLQSLKFSLWSFDRFSHHEIIADGLLHLSGLEKYGLSISREIYVAKKLSLVPKASGICGEIFLSLGYLKLAEKLAAVVIKIINLPKINNKIPDPFVEVSLLYADRKLKIKKTSTKERDHNPIYNETLTFHVPAEQLHETSLLFCVRSNMKNSSSSQILGKVLLGPEASGENFEHWDELRMGSKPKGRWHKLRK